MKTSGRKPQPLAARLDRLTEKGEGCWPWKGHRTRTGYGTICVGSRTDGSRNTVPAHRAAWEAANGPIPGGLFVLHECHNPSCVRPDHLRLGTHRDNMTDMVKAGRQAAGDRNGARLHPDRIPRGDAHWSHADPARVARGEQHGMAKLVEGDVVAIRIAYDAGGTSYQRLADFYGVTKHMIRNVVKRRNWKHVE
jgi:hypothetical protein